METEAPRLRVLIIDDHPIVRRGIRALLSQWSEVKQVIEAHDGESGFREYVETDPDIVLMDLCLPGISGFEATRRIVARDDGAKILAFSGRGDTEFVTRALQAGARGYLSKSCELSVLIDALEHLASGNIYLEPEIAQRLAYQKTRGPELSFASLTTREFEIFHALADGLTAAEIALRLSLSTKTVANYATQIKNKLEVNSTVGIVRLAIRHGIVRA
ncbi:MAG: two-component system invasion response regulator UvrY [Gammaproteobacteria bacterium]|jgi:two-component system invasion response regulator UvrY